MPTYLFKNRYGIYYFRFIIPKDIRPHLNGRREFRLSLRTNNQHLARLAAQRYSALFSLFVSEYREKKMKGRILGFGIKGLKVSNEGSIEIEEISTDPNLVDAEKALLDHLFTHLKELKGKDSSTAATTTTSIPSEEVTTKTLAELCDEFIKHQLYGNRWNEKTANEYRAALDLSIRILNNPSLDSLEYSTFENLREVLTQLPPNMNKSREFRDIESIPEIISKRERLKVEPLSIRSIGKNLERISSALKFAVKRDYIKTNFAEGLAPKDNRAPHEIRDIFTTEELISLFSIERYKTGSFKHPYQYWLPILGLYTGARIEELCRLQGQDIYKQDGIWVFHFHRGVKNKASVRKVPIHSKLLDLGFISLAHRLPPNERIFCELTLIKKKYSSKASDYFRTMTPTSPPN